LLSSTYYVGEGGESMIRLFTTETQSFITSLYACKSNKDNFYYKVYKSYRETSYTKESVKYNTLEEALVTYVSWCK
jgi:hypothetical protein